MLKNFLENALVNFIDRDSTQTFKNCIYALVIIGVVWLGIANYYHLIEECTKSYAAFISSIISFSLAVVVKILHLIKLNIIKREVNRHISNTGLLDKLKGIALIYTNLNSKKTATRLSGLAALVLGLYMFFRKR